MNEEEICICEHNYNCLVYKCVKNQFLNKKGEFVFQVRMIPQKRMSCNDCQRGDDLIQRYNDDNDYLKTDPEELVHGKYYNLEACNVRDEEDCDLRFARYEEVKPCIG